MDCTATYTITLADLKAGSVVNTATATAYDAGGTTALTASNNATVTGPTSLLDKTWVNGKGGDTVTLAISGSSTGNNVSGTNTVGGSSNTLATAKGGGTVTLTETFTTGSISNYNAPTIVCTNLTNQGTTSTAVTTTAVVIDTANNKATSTYTQPASGVTSCVFTNTRKSVTLKVAKTWGAGSIAGDSTTVSTTGLTNNPTSGSSTALAGGNTTLGGGLTVYAGDTGQLTETTFGNIAKYTQSYGCDTAGVMDTAGNITVPTTPATITCTLTNTRTNYNLTLTKTITGVAATAITADKSFGYSLTCDGVAYTGTVTVPSGTLSGSTTISIPSGAVCTTLTETSKATPPSGYIWATETVTLPSGPINASSTASITNPLATPGALSVSKTGTPYVKVNADTVTGNVNSLTPSTITYVITVTNTGGSPLSSVDVTDTLLGGLTYAGPASVVYSDSSGAYPATSAAAITNTGTATSLKFTLPTLTATNPGKSAQITFTATPTIASNANATAFSNSASAASGPISNSTQTPAVTNVVYTKLFKQVRNLTTGSAWGQNGTGLPGDLLEYCIAATNYGSVDLTQYTIADGVPANTKNPVVNTADDTAGTSIDLTKTTWDIDGSGPKPAIDVSGVASAGPFVLASKATKSMCFNATIK